MAGLPAPKSPSSLVKCMRWAFLGLGVMYGSTRHGMLKTKEDARRAKEEEERPAKEAAIKAEKDRKNREEMEILAREAGINTGGGSGPKSGGGGSGEYRSDCGCSY